MEHLWKGKSKTKVVEEYVSFIDLAPTFLEAASIDWKTSGTHPATGKSLMNIIISEKSGQIESQRDYVLVGKERHDTGRTNDVGYHIRGIQKKNMLYIKNYETDRWPSGNLEKSYLNTDASPTETEILRLRRENREKMFWKINFGKRVSEEVYNLKTDPFCTNNLANDPILQSVKNALSTEMERRLLNQGDLRMIGYGHLYEQYPFTTNSNFYGRFIAGKETSSGWVIESDFEEYFLDGYGNTLEKIVRDKPVKE